MPLSSAKRRRDVAQPLLLRWRRVLVNDPRLSAADRHVALTISLHLDKHGAGAYPSIRTLAGECARKAHTVTKSIQTLEKLGYLNVIRAAKRGRHGWSSDVNHYTAQLPLGATGAVAPSGPRQLPQGAYELSKSSDGGSPNGSAAVECPECEQPAGRHITGCSLAPATESSPAPLRILKDMNAKDAA